MQNNLTTTKTTNLILKKSKSMLNITNRILSGSKNLTTKSNKDVILHPDTRIINGLMWQKETVERMNGNDAMEYAKNLRLGGYDDWRLPTIEEFREIVSSCGGINVKYGDDNESIITNKNRDNKDYQSYYKSKGFLSYYYWSSSTEASNTNVAWLVGFNGGGTYSFFKGISKSVRCVRVGQ